MGNNTLSFGIKTFSAKKTLLYFFLIGLIISFACICEADDLMIHFIDVGEGESILIQTPENSTVLIDTGNLMAGFKVIEYLKKNNIDYLDYLILSHPHPDHIGGSFLVLQMLRVGKIYDNGADITEIAKSQDMYRWYKIFARHSDSYEALKAGDRLVIDEIALDVLWPPEVSTLTGFNNNSLVMILDYKEFRCLLTADTTIEAEKEILKQATNLKADILKVAHHGGDDANSGEFINAVSPKISILSINENNINGYPSNKILKRLKKINSKLYRTDKHGDIVIKVRNNDINITTEKYLQKQ